MGVGDPLLLHEMTRVELSEIAPRAIALLPAGATEQHGPHMPTGTTIRPAARIRSFTYAIRNIVSEAKKVEAAGRKVTVREHAGCLRRIPSRLPCTMIL